MAKKKQSNQPQKLFGKLVRVTKKRFDKDPDLKRPYRDVQKWVSQNLYPFFKGQKHNKLKIVDIQNAIERVLSSQIAKPTCGNVFVIPDGDIEEQNWWEFFDNLRKIDPNVKSRLNAGTYGVTSIMTASELMSDSEAARIIGEIRSGNRNRSGSTIIGFRRVVPGMKDDGNDCSYFVDFILSEMGVLVDNASDEVFQNIEQTEETMAARRERLLQLKNERRARIARDRAKKRKRPSATAEDLVEAEKAKDKEFERPKDFKALNKSMKQLEGFYKKGLITKKQFATLLEELIKKFEEGGEV
jgi:hypothetical protein